MKPATVILKILTGAAVVYTVFVLFICLFLSGNADMVVSPKHFLLIFPFSLAFSSANFLHMHTKLGGFFKFFLHLVFTVGGFTGFVFLPIYNPASGAQSFLIVALFALLYLIGYGIFLLFRHRWKKLNDNEPAYTAQFAPKNGTSKGRRS